MKFTYKIEASDFLEFQLFTASDDPIIQKRKMKSWILITAGCLIFGVFSFVNQTTFLGFYFIALAIIVGFFYPEYFKWRYKKHYANFITRNYSKRFGEPAEIEITRDYIYSKDKVTEGKVRLSAIEQVNETTNHFFIKMASGMSFIIPKRELKNPEQFRKTFKEINVSVKDQQNWKW